MGRLARIYRPAAARLAAVARKLRPGSDRATGSVAVVLVGAVAGVSVVAGAGAAQAQPRLANVGAWLGSVANGSLLHVNGLSGRPDGRVLLRDAAGHRLRVVQHGTSAYVTDEVTGQVSRIDPAQLEVAQTRGVAAGAQVVAGADSTYVVDGPMGTVQRIDPASLAPIGRPASLPPPLAPAGFDASGTLWVPVPAAGEVVPFRQGRMGTPVDVGSPNDPLVLTVAQGTPVITNLGTATSTVVGLTGGQLRVSLPSVVASRSPQVLLAPAATEGRLVPLLAPSSDALVVVDIARGSLSTLSLDAGGHRLGAPQVLGHRVYIPDETTGSLIVYDVAAARFDSQIAVSGREGPLEVFVQGGRLWVNDQGSAAAAVVQADGSVLRIGKYETQVPGPRAPGDAVPPPAAGQGSRGTGGTATGGSAPGRSGPPSTSLPAAPAPARPSPPPTPPPATPAPAPPTAPGTITATSGPGWIQVTFTPSGGGTPQGYALLGSPAGMTSLPAQVPPQGPFTFQATGGSCATQYTFRVAALYPGGQVQSVPSVPVRPCVPPGAPRSLRATAGNHRADLDWTAPSSTGGSAVTYDLTWRGATSGTRSAIAGLSTAVTSLVNGGTYSFRLSAVNPAGSSASAATATATLIGPAVTYATYNNPTEVLNVRSGPGTSYPSLAQFPPRSGRQVTVLCQTQGEKVTDDTDPSLTGSIWDRVSGFGPSAYVSDLYVKTPQSVAGHYSSYSYPPLWQCT